MPITHRRPICVELTAEETVARRWKTCLHEAGHIVAGRTALKRTVKAVVYNDGVGAAYLEIDGGLPRTFEEALAVAAGSEAEALAEAHAPPEASQPAPALTTTDSQSVKPMVTQLRRSPSDAVALAQWCIRGIENEPDRWAKRCYWIRREANLFVARHQQQIVDAAKGLYANGFTTLEAEPAHCKKDGVPSQPHATMS